MRKQPLSYQHENACWVVSLTNALNYLLTSDDSLPLCLSRIIYAAAGDEGIENEEAEALVQMINHYPVPIMGQVIKQQQVNKTRVHAILRQKNTVLVCDTMNGGHAVLVTGSRKGCVELFDPCWDYVIAEPALVPGKFERLPDGQYTNVKVQHQTFFSKHFVDEDRTPFTTGRIKDRFAYVLARTQG